MYHYRSHAGLEIDILLEDRAGSIVALEVKSSETVLPRDFKNIRRFQETYPDLFKRGIILYGGTRVLAYGSDMYALPISALWATKAC